MGINREFENINKLVARHRNAMKSQIGDLSSEASAELCCRIRSILYYPLDDAASLRAIVDLMP